MHEVQAHVTAPKTVRIEKRGDYFYAFASGDDGRLEPSGASTKVALTSPFYIGIGGLGVGGRMTDELRRAFPQISLFRCRRPALQAGRRQRKSERDRETAF